MPIALTDGEFQQLVQQAGAAPAASLSNPFMYQARPDPGLYGMVAPMMGYAMGMSQPTLLPQAGGPRRVSAFDAMYAQQNTDAIRQSQMSTYLSHVSQQMAGSTGGILMNLGVHNALGMSPGQLQSNLYRGAGSPAGQMECSNLSRTIWQKG